MYCFGISELVRKAFASRLSEIRRNIFVISETIVPKIDTGNVLIAISGSGETEPTLTITKKQPILMENYIHNFSS